MNARERVLTAIHHERPDRVPVNFRSTDIVAERLCARHGFSYEDLLNYFQVDFREVIPPYNGPALAHTENTYYDEWGVRRKILVTERSRDIFVDESPLADVEDEEDLERILNYKWPSPDDYDFSVVEKMCDSYEGYSICGPGIHCEGYHGVFHQLTYLFGMENAMMLLATEEELMKAACQKITDYWVGYFDRLLTASKGKMDLIFYKDDMGSQNSLLVSQDMFLKYFAPALKQLNDMCASHNAFMIYHTCGSVQPLIPDFLDAGVTILDPIQTSAKNMDIEVLEQRFGKDLVFHGGMDTQHDLPGMTVEEIEALTKKTIATLGKDGGYLFSPSHRIQQDTPLENIEKMYEVALNWNEY